MDGERFDSLTRQLSSRRIAIGGLVAGFLLPLDAAHGKGKRRQRKHSRKDERANIQGEPCWRAAACIPGKNTNVSRCDLSRYASFPSQDSAGSNLSRANLSGVSARGVDFARANLSGACLVDADFTGANFKNANLANAIFCRTSMPDGRIENSGCQRSTACCATCRPDCAGKCGGVSDGCSGFCAGPCPTGQDCLSNGSCAQPCPNSGNTGPCPSCGQPTCERDTRGPYYCLDASVPSTNERCRSNTDCDEGYYCIYGAEVCRALCTV